MANFLDEGNMELIKKLYDGKMNHHPRVRSLIDRALRTGDCGPLKDFLRRYPAIMAAAEINIAGEIIQQIDNPFKPYPSQEEARRHLNKGFVRLGYVNDFDGMFSVHPDLFCTHVMNAGGIGTGKSALTKYVAAQLMNGPGFHRVLIADLKREYRNLLPVCPSLRVFQNKIISVNPWEVPEFRTPEDHIFATAKIWISENYLLGTSLNELINILEGMYRARGIFDGGINYPNMTDIYRVVTEMLNNSRLGRYVDVLRWLQNRLLPYTFSENFRCRFGIGFDVFRDENLVLEMDTRFTDHMYNFLLAYLADMIYSHNKEKGLTGSKLRTLFVVDEGRILFNAHRDISEFGESVLNEIVSKSREYGVGFWVSSQETSSFNQVIRSLCRLKIAFPLTDAKDLDFIQGSYGLNDDQKEHMFKLTETRQAVVRYSGFERPFLIGVPPFKPERELTDQELETAMGGFYAEIAKRVVRSEQKPLQVSETVPPDATTLLFNLSRAPFTKVSDMTKFSAFASPEGVARALTWLSDHGYVERQEYRIARRGRKSKFAVLTGKAYAFLGEKPPAGKGGFYHCFCQDIIYRWLTEKGIKAKIEAPIKKGSPKTCDVLARSGEQGLKAYEVTLHFDNLLDNIREDIAVGADEVVVVTRDKPDMDRATRMVSQDRSLDPLLDRILFKTIDEFFS